MRAFQLIAAIAISFTLCACSGGGGSGGSTPGPGGNSSGSSTSISLSSTSLSFTASDSGVAPEAKPVTVTFVGDGVLVGTLPGQIQPPWLGVSQASEPVNQKVTFNISVYQYGLAAGIYTATLRFVTGKADGSQAKTADLTITLTVQEGFGTSTSSIAFEEIDGDPNGPLPAYSDVQIKGDNISWHAKANAPWLALNQQAGTAKGTLRISTTRQSLVVGSYQSSVELSDDVSGRTITIDVSYKIRAAQITLNGQPYSFNVTLDSTSSALSNPFTISDELNGAVTGKDVTWSSTFDQSWIKITPSSGRSAPTVNATVSLVPEELNLLASGHYIAHLKITSTDSNGASNERVIPYDLEVRMPSARVAAPYNITPNTPTTITLRGEDFQSGDLSALRLNGAPLSNAPIATDAVTLSLSLPSLPAGDYVFTFENAMGLSRSAAKFSVATPPSIGTGVLDTGHVTRLMFEPVHARLYALDRSQELVLRYQWNGSSWAALSSWYVPAPRDLALSRDGVEVFIASSEGLYVAGAVDVNASPVFLTKLEGSFADSYDTPNYIGVLDSGMAIIVQTFAGSGSTDLLKYDTLSRKTIKDPLPFNGYYYEGRLGLSADGRYALIGGFGLSPGDHLDLIDSHSSPTNVFGTLQVLEEGNYLSLDLSADGSKVIHNFSRVRTVDSTPLGNLPVNPVFSKISPDGRRAYVLVLDPEPGHIDVYDLTAPPYTVTSQISLPQRVAPANYDSYVYPSQPYPFNATISPDGNYMFLSGPERIEVLTLPP